MFGLIEKFTVYLPIADISVNLLVICCAAIFSGSLSGMFGVGGGLSLIPILTIIGVDPGIAVASNTNQTIASSISGYLAYARKNRVDYILALTILIGGLLGVFLGIRLTALLRNNGLLDLVTAICFLLLLGTIGITTMVSALNMLCRNYMGIARGRIHRRWRFSIRLPWQIKFPSAHREISILLPVLVGIIGGISTSFLGIGGGFVMVPAMIHLLSVSEAFTAGTTHFQAIFTTIFATVLYCYSGRYFDIVLSAMLMLASAIGVQLGARMAHRVHPENFRILLAIVILILCIRMFWQYTSVPRNIFELEPLDLFPSS